MGKAPYHHGNLRETCIEIGQSLICAEGVDALSMTEVARQAGVSAPALYRHFESREDFLDAVRLYVLNALSKRSRDRYILFEAGSIDGLTAVALEYLDTFLADPPLISLMTRPHTDLPEDGPDHAFEIVRQATRDFLEVHPNASATEDEVAQSMWSIPHGASHLAASGMYERLFDNVDPRKIVRDTLSAYLKGLES